MDGEEGAISCVADSVFSTGGIAVVSSVVDGVTLPSILGGGGGAVMLSSIVLEVTGVVGSAGLSAVEASSAGRSGSSRSAAVGREGVACASSSGFFATCNARGISMICTADGIGGAALCFARGGSACPALALSTVSAAVIKDQLQSALYRS